MTRTALVVNRTETAPAQIEALYRTAAAACVDAGWPAPELLLADSLDQGGAAAGQALRDGAELVVACGGDVTVSAVAEALAEAEAAADSAPESGGGIGLGPGGRVVLGIVPLGAGNLLAASLGVPGDMDEAINTLIVGVDRRIDLGVVRSADRGRVDADSAGVTDGKSIKSVKSVKSVKLVKSVKSIPEQVARVPAAVAGRAAQVVAAGAGRAARDVEAVQAMQATEAAQATNVARDVEISQAAQTRLPSPASIPAARPSSEGDVQQSPSADPPRLDPPSTDLLSAEPSSAEPSRAALDSAPPPTLGGGRVLVGLAGLGLDAKVVADVSTGLRRRIGWPAYLLPIARHLGDRGVTLTLELDGRTVRHRAVRAALIGNVGRVCGSLDLLPDAAPDDGLLDVVILAPRGRILGWPGVVRELISSRARNTDDVIRYRAGHIVARTRRPVAREVDGELLGSGVCLDVRVLHLALAVRVPRPAPTGR